jgi:hypothetical protein
MVKKKKNYNTPIEFNVSDSEFGGRGPRVPTPINQPNWEYLYIKSKPSVFEWFFAIILWAGIILLAILLVSESIYTEPPWLIVIIFGIPAILMTISIGQRTAAHIRKKQGKPAQSRKRRKSGKSNSYGG